MPDLSMITKLILHELACFCTPLTAANSICTLHKSWMYACMQVAWVPGSFEMPLIAKAMAKSGIYDAVITVGAVVSFDSPTPTLTRQDRDLTLTKSNSPACTTFCSQHAQLTPGLLCFMLKADACSDQAAVLLAKQLISAAPLHALQMQSGVALWTALNARVRR
jgi:hypothetical protein